jgi:Eukaryotic protein of unknown function (DUF953)
LYFFLIAEKGANTNNQIICPNCKKTIANNPVIDEAAKGVGSDTQFVVCDCGENISYWQITAQLRDQKKLGRRLLGLFKGTG